MSAVVPAGPAIDRQRPGFGAVSAGFRLGMAAVLTRGRIVGSLLLIALVLFQFSAFSSQDLQSGVSPTALLFGLVVSLLVPVFVVSTASNVFGSAVSDGTLVYPWLRPAARWKIALGHIGAGAALNVGVALVAGGGGAAVLARTFDLPGSDVRGVALAAMAAVLAAVAYSPVVTALGLRFKRASTFAYVYIFLWEQIFARNSTGLARFSIQTYIRSAYAGLAEKESLSELGNFLAGSPGGETVSPGIAWIVLTLLVALGVALTAFFLKRADVA